MKTDAFATLTLRAASNGLAPMPVNYGDRKPALAKPFDVRPVAAFNNPWALTFLPDGRMLVTGKPGHLWLVTAAGAKTP